MKNVNKDPIVFRQGWILISTSTVRGGVHYDRMTIDDSKFGSDGRKHEFKTVKTMDHETLCVKAQRCVQSARYALRKSTAQTGLGGYADDDMLAKIRNEFSRLEDDCNNINREAGYVGSERRISVGFVALPLTLDNEAAAKALAESVHTSLTTLRDSLRAGNLDKISNAMRNCKNLHKLATGIQSDAIRFALETVSDRRKQVVEALARKESPESAGNSLDLDAIENAVTLFTVSDESEIQYMPLIAV